MRKALPVLALILLAAALPALPAPQGPNLSGLWDAMVLVNRAEIPFRFEIAQNGTRAQGFFFEGDRRVGSTSGSFQDGRLKLEYDFLDTVFEAVLDGNQLRGTYRERNSTAGLPIWAHRFTPAAAPAGSSNVPQVAGTWDMRRVSGEAREPSDTRTWNLYLRQSGAEVSGSILRVDGDTGNLSGHWQGDNLILSHFAGERPLLFEARLNPDRTLSIALNREAHYLAVRKSEARAKGIPEPPDPSRYTSVKDPTAPFHFSFPDLDGKIVSDQDARFRGKVVLLAIGGSWCPNCHDEAPFLVELYKQYHAQGLEIVGLMFETDSDPAVAGPHVQRFMRRYGIPYTMLLAGTPEQIHQKLPQLVNFGAYPTTIYLGRDGRVRSVHAGFASPATGQEHVRLKNEASELVARLLAEGPQNKENSRGL